MGIGPSTGQGRLPPHDTRDVRTTSANTQQYDWSQLAEAPETNTLLADAKPYTFCREFNYEHTYNFSR